jgi:hypothetical protein
MSDVRARRNPEQVTVRGYGAGHAGSMRLRIAGRRGGVEGLGDGALQVGIAPIDLGIDQRDQNVAAKCKPVHGFEMQFLDRILCRVAGRQ